MRVREPKLKKDSPSSLTSTPPNTNRRDLSESGKNRVTASENLIFKKSIKLHTSESQIP